LNKQYKSTLKHKVTGTLIFSCILLPLVYTSCHKPDSVPPVVKKLDESVYLHNKNELNYTATLSNVNSAKLVVNKDGVLVFSEDISDVAASGPDYQMTFKYVKDDPTMKNITKGKYEFILNSDDPSDKLEKKSAIEIINYLPTANTAVLDNSKLNFMEAFETSLSIPKSIFIDDNPEDNPVSATSVKSIDGKTVPTLKITDTGYDLTVKAVSGSLGLYQLELDFGSVAGGLEKTILSGTIGKDTRIKFNPFIQPNDSTLNWYGSGDVDNNNTVDSQDLARLNNIINGTYSNPNDRRLMDRADVNGDGIVNSDDVKILSDKLNGVIADLPGYWNNLTPDQKESWRAKMFVIDKTNEHGWTSTYNCTIFTYQTIINFNGANSKDVSRLQAFYPFEVADNGRFNIPVEALLLYNYDISTGKVVESHAINVIFMGDNSDYNNILKIEPQNDRIDLQLGQGVLAPYGNNSKLDICGFPTLEENIGNLQVTKYITYTVSNNIPTVIYTNPLLVTQRGK